MKSRQDDMHHFSSASDHIYLRMVDRQVDRVENGRKRMANHDARMHAEGEGGERAKSMNVPTYSFFD